MSHSSSAGGRAASPLAARRLRVWVDCFELALDISHLVRAIARPAAPGSAAAARRLMDAAARLPLALARAQAAGPLDQAARCLDDALAGLAEMDGHLALCRRLDWLEAAGAADIGARCAQLRKDVICLAAEARALHLSSKETSHAQRSS